MDKKKKIILLVCIILIAIIAIVLITIKSLNNRTKDNEGYNKVFEITKEELQELDKIDVETIDVTKELDGKTFETEDMIELSKTTTEMPVAKQENRQYYAKDYKYSFVDAHLYLVDTQGNKKEYNNVEKVYYQYIDCQEKLKFFILANNKVYILNVSMNGEQTEETYDNKTYDTIYKIYISSATCGAVYDYVGHTKDSKYYKLTSGDEVDLSIKYYRYQFIKADRKVIGEDLTAKAVLTDAYPTDNVQNIIDDNNYLYNCEYINNTPTLKKLSEKKVKTIYYSNDKAIAYIEFEDETFYDNKSIDNIHVEY